MDRILLLLLMFISGNSFSQNHEKDSIALLKLTQSFYKWELTKSKLSDFDPLQIDENDTIYPRLDRAAFESRLNELRSSTFFTTGFLENYAAMFELFNSKIESGELIWYTGELSPFGNGSNPWCNCQDVPSDNFWETIRIVGLEIKGNTAQFYWTWSNDFLYAIEAQKEGKHWRISSLENLDPVILLRRSATIH